MTQKTIKALYKQPVDYKLIRDGYKTVNGVINAQDGMPKVLNLPVPSELYTTDLQYNVNTEVNGAPVITTEQFTLPDNEICEAKTYCYAPKGINYNYTEKQEVIHKYLDTTTYTVNGSPTINTSSGIITNFYSSNNINIGRLNFTNKFELYAKIYCTTHASKFWFSSLIGGSGCPGIGTDSNGYMRFYNGSNYEVGYFNLNTWYWVYFVQENSTSKLYYIQDNGYELDTLPNINQWSIGPSIGSNLFSSSYGFKIGTNTNYSSEYWSGSVDLSGFLIKADGQIAWKPFVKETRVEETVVPIPGMLDSSVTTDDWQQNQEYKLYQLKNQNNTDALQLTENSITDTSQKYKQYINQLTIPARDYKWYYNGIPQSKDANFWSHGATIENEIGIDFTGGPIEVYPLNYMGHDSDIVTVIFNIETGDVTTDCIFFDMYSNYEEEASVLFAIRNSKFSYNTYVDSTQIIYGDTILSSNTKYWVALSLNKTQMKLELYLIQDNNYSKEQLPDISLWLKQFEYNVTNPETMYAYSYIGASTSSSVSISSFNGKVYLNNMFATGDLTTTYEYLCWESYSYSDFVYRWYANKSLYNYTENESYADILNFSDSWVNVTNDWKTQKKYVNPEVLLMPTQVNGYLITREISEVLYTDLSTLPSTLLDNNNFIMSGTALASGPTSYNIDGAKSFGYFTYTPTKNETITIKAYVSSEGNYDYGACYIGTQLYNASRDQITSQATDGNGSWLFLISGSTSETTYTKDLLEGVTYYIHFYYTKDGSSSTGNDRVFITSLSGFSKKENVSIPLPGCLHNYNDDGSEHSFDVYYDSNYTQPILVPAGQTYSEGTKVDTITLPKHKTWEYSSGGIWNSYAEIDVSNSNYTNTDGNLVLTEYTGNAQDVTLPNPEL